MLTAVNRFGSQEAVNVAFVSAFVGSAATVAAAAFCKRDAKVY